MKLLDQNDKYIAESDYQVGFPSSRELAIHKLRSALIKATNATMKAVEVEEKEPMKIGLDRYYIYSWEDALSAMKKRWEEWVKE